MDLSSLAVFVAVAEHGGFSAAAEKLHLSQPAVSKRIALLEAELDVRLLDRLGRQVVPTEAGLLLLGRARGLLEQAADTRRALAALGDGIGGTLRIATSHHIGLHHLPPCSSAMPSSSRRWNWTSLLSIPSRLMRGCWTAPPSWR